MPFRTIAYRIESCPIPRTPGFSRQVWFLDAVQVADDGHRSLSNICSGEKRYCEETLACIRRAGQRVEVSS